MHNQWWRENDLAVRNLKVRREVCDLAEVTGAVKQAVADRPWGKG